MCFWFLFKFFPRTHGSLPMCAWLSLPTPCWCGTALPSLPRQLAVATALALVIATTVGDSLPRNGAPFAGRVEWELEKGVFFFFGTQKFTLWRAKKKGEDRRKRCTRFSLLVLPCHCKVTGRGGGEGASHPRGCLGWGAPHVPPYQQTGGPVVLRAFVAHCLGVCPRVWPTLFYLVQGPAVLRKVL